MSLVNELCKKRRKNFLWGDNYWNENGKIWFVSSRLNMIICIDEKTSIITPVVKIPGCSGMCFRQHSRCIKYSEKIFCFPDMGEDIYIYNLKKNIWKKIFIYNPNAKRVGIYDFWKCDSLLYIVSNGLNKIIVLELEKEIILGVYNIITDDFKDNVIHSIKLGHFIYSLSSQTPKIYKFDCEKKTVHSFMIPNINDKLYTICFDGKKFWFSGYSKKIYIWDEVSNTVNILNDFPRDFGIYDFSGKQNELLDCKSQIYISPTFLSSVKIANFIWFIPFRTNKILFVEKDNLTIYEYFLDTEIRTRKDIKEGLLDHMYLFEYIKEDRYIGLLTLQTGNIVEIDCLDLQDKNIEYIYNEKCDEIILQSIFESNYNFCENKQLILFDLLKYNKNLNFDKEAKSYCKIGNAIYTSLNYV